MGLFCCRPYDQDSTPKQKAFVLKPSLQDFEILKLLGKGTFSEVLLVRRIFDEKLFVMKVMKKSEIKARNEIIHILSERKTLESAASSFIIPLICAFQTTQKLYLVMELMAGGDLFYHLSKQQRFKENSAKFYICEVILALELMHSKSIIYRDLKPENIVLDLKGHIRLIDFGLSKQLSNKTQSICGTPEYQAPEIVLKLPYSTSVDFWTIGCLLYEMIYGMSPFRDSSKEKLKQKILTANAWFNLNFSQTVRDLISQLLHKDPEVRLCSFEAIKSHPFFEGVDWEKVKNKETEPPIVPSQEGLRNFDESVLSITPESSDPYLGEPLVLDEFEGFSYTDEAFWPK